MGAFGAGRRAAEHDLAASEMATHGAE